MKRRFGLLAAGVCVAAACAKGGDTTPAGGAGGHGGSGHGSGAGTTSSTHTGGEGVISTTSACASRCSADLHSVVDCEGNVLSTCPDDQGCGPMGCIPACESAEANESTIGCDYYAVAPDVIPIARGGCFAAYVVNTWSAPVTIAIERKGQALDASKFAYISKGNGQSISYQPLPNGKLPPGEVAIVFLSQSGSFAPCPATAGVGLAEDTAVHGTGLGSAFHITTSAPVVVYDIFPYGGGQSAVTSATLLLPTTTWDTNYIVVDGYEKSTKVAEAQPSIDIVAREDGTAVTIGAKAAIEGAQGVAPVAKGQLGTYTLDKGQVLQITQDASLLGSAIKSTKPIGLWGASSCLSIDVDQQACDSAHQQIPPIKALGHEYVAARYRNRFENGEEEAPPFRLVGAVANTQLTYEPSPPPGAPTTLAAGQAAIFRSPGPFLVKSQDADHPFYMAAHMTGCGEVSTSASDCRGDPEFVNVVPPEQYLKSYVFFTDPTYPETNLVIVRRDEGDGFKDVMLDCAGGPLGGWTSVNGQYQITRVDLVRHNFAPQGGCDNGRHEIHSDAPFGLVVWGWGTAETGGSFGMSGGGFYSLAVSYAYPAGARVHPINQIEVLPIPE